MNVGNIQDYPVLISKNRVILNVTFIKLKSRKNYLYIWNKL